MLRKNYLFNLSDTEMHELLELTRKDEIKARKMKQGLILL